jgi:hypothetical protein
MPYVWENVIKDGTKSFGGAKSYFLYCLKSEITNTNALEINTTISTNREAATLNEAVTFAGTDGWKKVEGTVDMSMFKAETIGVRDTTGKKLAAQFRHPGNATEALAFANQIENKDVLVLVPDNNGQYFFMGTDGLEAQIKSTFDTKKISEGDTGLVFDIETYGKGVCQYPDAFAITLAS